MLAFRVLNILQQKRTNKNMNDNNLNMFKMTNTNHWDMHRLLMAVNVIFRRFCDSNIYKQTWKVNYLPHNCNIVDSVTVCCNSIEIQRETSRRKKIVFSPFIVYLDTGYTGLAAKLARNRVRWTCSAIRTILRITCNRI